MRKWIESALGAIGITRYTNRDALMDELGELPDDKFMRIIGHCNLDDMVVHASCAECKAANDGKCIHQGDDEYCGEYDPTAWLNRSWTGTRIITEEASADV